MSASPLLELLELLELLAPRTPFSTRMNAFQLRQQDNAFLFVGVGASDNRRDRFGLAGVVRQMRYVGRYIEEISGLHDRVVLEALAVPYMRDPAQGVDRSL